MLADLASQPCFSRLQPFLARSARGQSWWAIVTRQPCVCDPIVHQIAADACHLSSKMGSDIHSLLCADVQAYVGFLTAPCPSFPELSRLDFLLRFHMQEHPYRAMNFTKHNEQKWAVASICKQLTADCPKETLVGFGDCCRAGAGIVKKQRGSAGAVERALRATGATVVSVDEYNTSKKCAQCGITWQGYPWKRPRGWQFSLGRTWTSWGGR